MDVLFVCCLYIFLFYTFLHFLFLFIFDICTGAFNEAEKVVDITIIFQSFFGDSFARLQRLFLLKHGHEKGVAVSGYIYQSPTKVVNGLQIYLGHTDQMPDHFKSSSANSCHHWRDPVFLVPPIKGSEVWFGKDHLDSHQVARGAGDVQSSESSCPALPSLARSR